MSEETVTLEDGIVADVSNTEPGVPGVDQELDSDLRQLRDLVDRMRVDEAREFVKALEKRWPDSAHVRHFARVLAPPTTSLRPDLKTRPLDRERAWIRQHAKNYPGCWLAVRGNRLVAADRDLRKVLASLRSSSGGERALLHFQPGNPE